ncbi:MAG TPA: hypothetical protein VIU39_04665 [Anaerolineales bacterium]
MDSDRPRREGWLYALAFVLALALRLIRLGAFPLADAEALQGLQAMQVAAGARGAIGPNPAYALITGALFFLFDHSNFIARLVPALMGALLVLAPALFKSRLKPRVAVILAFFLALDPGLLAVSRQAGSGILAVAALVFAWGFWERGRPRAAGISAALALLGGPAFWAGLLGLALSWAILQSMDRPAPPNEAEAAPRAARAPFVTEPLKPALTAFLITFVLLGTLFFTVPGGLTGALEALLAYLRGWVTPSKITGRVISFALLAYQPLTVLLALAALVRGWIGGSRRVIRLTVWALVTLLLAVFYPGHQIQDLAWALIPLSALAALELSRHFDMRREERLEVGGVLLLTSLILIFAWLDLASLPWTPGPSGEANLRIWLFAGALFLLAVSILLVAVGWSARSARLGAVWGVTLMLGLYSLSAGLAAGRLRANYTSELWAAGTYPVHAALLTSTVDDLSQWSRGNNDAQPVTIYNYDSAALRWLLRDHAPVVVDGLDPASAPPLLITPLMDNPGLAARYRGQDFTWDQEPAWDAARANDWVRWLVLRDMPQQYKTLILWARDDLFLNRSLQTTP